MRLSHIGLLGLAGALTLSATPSSAQISVTAQIGQPQYEVRVSPYTPEAYGDWHSSYRRWQTTTLYSADGHFYSRPTPGARPVSVYRSQNSYFLPPRDREFDNMDQRYNYDHRPMDGDYNVVLGVSSLFGIAPQRSWGNEVFLTDYSSDIHGEWRINYRKWQPVTLYNRNGRYFPTAVPGARAVAVYRWQNQYFLPPTDDQWRNSDRRYNYGRAPNQDDYNNPQRSPGRFAQQEPGQSNETPTTGYGNELAVTNYSPRVHGEWQTSYSQWQPATVYHLNGKYYPNQVSGSRSLMVYQSQGQYFLPPRDQQWTNADRRYNYSLRPTDQDYNNMQRFLGRP